MSVRKESKLLQCHPKDEQKEVDFMQRFYWNLQGTQAIHTIDNHLETRGANLYSVSNQQQYVKLHFSRELDIPNLDKIRALESEYALLPIPKFPKLFPGSGLLWFFLFFFSFGMLIPVWLLYVIFVYSLKKPRAQREYEQYEISRQEIMERLEHIEKLNEQFDQPARQEIKPQLQV